MIRTSTVMKFLQSVRVSSFARDMPLRLEHHTLTITLGEELIIVNLAERDSLTQLEELAIRESLARDLDHTYACGSGQLLRTITNLHDVFTFWKELREDALNEDAA
jgi:hypothetical protein